MLNSIADSNYEKQLLSTLSFSRHNFPVTEVTLLVSFCKDVICLYSEPESQIKFASNLAVLFLPSWTETVSLCVSCDVSCDELFPFIQWLLGKTPAPPIKKQDILKVESQLLIIYGNVQQKVSKNLLKTGNTVIIIMYPQLGNRLKPA